jgi:hypothetical protein
MMALLLGLDPAAADAWERGMAEHRRLIRLPDTQKRQWAEDAAADPDVQEACRESVQLLQALTQEAVKDAGGEFDQEEEKRVENAMDTVEMQFLIRVWLPCLALYGEHPGKLLRAARLGDLTALDHLLRLDKGIIADPGIARELHTAALMPHRARFNRLAQAFASPIRKVTAARIKVNFSGLISKLAIFMNHPLTAPEIRELFDALEAAEKDSPHAIDTDLPTRADTLAREIHAARAVWGIFPEPERKAP